MSDKEHTRSSSLSPRRSEGSQPHGQKRKLTSTPTGSGLLSDRPILGQVSFWAPSQAHCLIYYLQMSPSGSTRVDDSAGSRQSKRRGIPSSSASPGEFWRVFIENFVDSFSSYQRLRTLYPCLEAPSPVVPSFPSVAGHPLQVSSFLRD